MLLLRTSGFRLRKGLHAHKRTVRALASAQDIEESIRLSQARKAAQRSKVIACPGCSQKSLAPRATLAHLRQCCPDLIHSCKEWQEVLQKPVDKDEVQRLLDGAEQMQSAAQARALQLAFAQKDASGNPIRVGPEEFAPTLGVSNDRAARLLRSAIKATPMPADPVPVEVLYEDEVLIAVNKPPHVNATPIHRHVGHSMVNRLITYLGKPPHVVHRLDMDTTGVMVFAKEQHVLAAMHEQFRQRTVSKLYTAICLGVPSRCSGMRPETAPSLHAAQTPTWEVDAPLAKHHTVANAGCVTSAGKAASTRVRVLAENPCITWEQGVRGEAWLQPADKCMEGACLLECVPRTGRTHQIRLHCAASGHPIVGDTLYGTSTAAIDRHALHASRLCFQHPVTAEPVEVTAQLPHDMKRLAAAYSLTTVDG